MIHKGELSEQVEKTLRQAEAKRKHVENSEDLRRIDKRLKEIREELFEKTTEGLELSGETVQEINELVEEWQKKIRQ